MLTFPRYSIVHDQRAASAYERIQKVHTTGNWRSPSQILTHYPKPGESLLGFLVRCQKANSICLMCPRCGDVHDKKAAEMFIRVPYIQVWGNRSKVKSSFTFDKRGIPKRQDNPHPKVNRRVTFKLPIDIPTN